MTLKQNITSILECYFSGFKNELIEACANRIMEQIERQADTPQTEKTCDNCGTPRDKCVYCIEEDRMWTPQTGCAWK